MKLPTFYASSKSVDQNNANVLEQFIYNNEPAGIKDSMLFRSGLVAVINWTAEEITEPMNDEEE